jgi:hypothetical protein
MQAAVVRANLSYEPAIQAFNKYGEEIKPPATGDISYWLITPHFKNIGGTNASNFKGGFNIDIDHQVNIWPASERIKKKCSLPSHSFDPNDHGGVIYPGSSFSLMSKPLSIEQARAASGDDAKTLYFYQVTLSITIFFRGRKLIILFGVRFCYLMISGEAYFLISTEEFLLTRLRPRQTALDPRPPGSLDARRLTSH